MKLKMIAALLSFCLFIIGSFGLVNASDDEFSKQEFEKTQSAAIAGDAEALYKLGQAYLYGFFVEGDYTARNPQKGLPFLEKAAKAGHAGAQYEYGEALLVGLEIKRDIKEGRKWMEKAAAQGNQDAIDVLSD